MFTLLLKGYQSLLDVANHMHLFTKLNEQLYLNHLNGVLKRRLLEKGGKNHMLEEINDCRGIQ
ncbi:hypothetical protein D1839_03440 [Roseburia sp. 1XD42-34]|nr:hypothetical protein [Roseburia sp. 1XD42-34]